MDQHALFSPSAMKANMKCLGRVPLIQKINPPDTAGEAAHQGSVCHDVAYKLITGEMTVTPLGQTFEGVLITEELFDGIKLYCKHVLKTSKDMEGQSFYEAKVIYTESMWGTVDAFHHNSSILFLQDLKMGGGVYVDAADNTQLKCYSLAALRSCQIQPAIVIMEIVQPMYTQSESKIRTQHMFTKDLLAWEQEELIPYFNAVEPYLSQPNISPDISLPPGIFTPGEEQCRWCDVSMECDAFHQAATSGASASFKEFVTSPTPAIVNPAEQQAEKVIEIYEKLPLLETFIKEVKDHMKVNVIRGNEGYEKYKMVAGLGNSAWTDEQQALSYLKGLGASMDHLHNPRKFKSPTQVKKVLKEGKFEAPNLANYIHRPETSAKMVPIEHEAAAVTETAQESFQKVLENNPPASEEIIEVKTVATTINTPETIPVIPETNDIADTQINPGGNRVSSPTEAWNEEFKKPGGYLRRARGEVYNHTVPEKRGMVLAGSGKTLADVAKEMGVTVANIKLHLSWLNKTNGYETITHENGIYEVITGKETESVGTQAENLQIQQDVNPIIPEDLNPGKSPDSSIIVPKDLGSKESLYPTQPQQQQPNMGLLD